MARQRPSAALDPYSRLGVPRTASVEEIRCAYKTLLPRYHPDRNSSPGAIETFKQIVEAYELLSDPLARDQWDRAVREREADEDAAFAETLQSGRQAPRPRRPSPTGTTGSGTQRGGADWERTPEQRRAAERAARMVETILAEMESDTLVGPGILSITGWLTCLFQMLWSISPGCPAQEMMDLEISFWGIWWITAIAGAWLLAGASQLHTALRKLFGPHWRGSTRWLGSHLSLVLMALFLLTVFPVLVYVKQAGVSARAAQQETRSPAGRVVASNREGRETVQPVLAPTLPPLVTPTQATPVQATIDQSFKVPDGAVKRVDLQPRTLDFPKTPGREVPR